MWRSIDSQDINMKVLPALTTLNLVRIGLFQQPVKAGYSSGFSGKVNDSVRPSNSKTA